jgi:hypothetical protein
MAGRKLGTTARDKESEKSMSSLSKLSFLRRFAALHAVAAPSFGLGLPPQDWCAVRSAPRFGTQPGARRKVPPPMCRQRCAYKEAKLAAGPYQSAKRQLLSLTFANWLVCPDEFQSFVLQGSADR